MAASQNDLVMRTGASTVTTLSAPGRALAAASITVGSTTNYPTTTGFIVAIRVVDSNGELVAGTYSEFTATVTSGTTLAISTSPVYGTDQVYAAGSTTQVFIPLSAYAHNRFVDAFTAEHSQLDGVHALTSSSTLTSSKIITGLNDTNGNELLKVTATASAINELTLANAAVGNAPALSATGGDTNIGIALTPKGTGTVRFPLDKSALTGDYNPYKFSVYRGTAWTTGNFTSTKVVFDTEEYDTNNNFATGTYTVPVNGFYLFSSSIGELSTTAAGIPIVSLYKNGAEVKRGQEQPSGETGNTTSTLTALYQCTAGDTIEIYFRGSNTSGVAAAVGTWFTGILMCRT